MERNRMDETVVGYTYATHLALSLHFGIVLLFQRRPQLIRNFIALPAPNVHPMHVIPPDFGRWLAIGANGEKWHRRIIPSPFADIISAWRQPTSSPRPIFPRAGDTS